jgi:hypothetical protein
LGILLGLKAVFLVLVARPMLMVFSFSSGTSDIRKSSLRSLVIFGAAILFVLAFAWAALLTFQPDWQFSLIGGLTGVGTSTGFSAFYRMQYDRHRFDLIQHSR